MYLAVKALSFGWPTEQGMRWFAEKTAEGGTRYEDLGITRESVYQFLSQCWRGAVPAPGVFGDLEDDPFVCVAAPFFVVVSAHDVFLSEGQSLGDFIDEFEDAYEKARMLDSHVLAALMARVGAPCVEQAPAG